MASTPDPVPSATGRSRFSWRSAAAIVVGNLIPVFGVIFLGWDAVQILLLYWCENVIIGVMTLPRILGAQVVEPTTAPGPGEIQIPLNTLGGRTLLALFFVLHYGLFCLGHGFFATVLLADHSRDWPALWTDTFDDRDFRLSILGIVAVQVVLLVKDWILPASWRRTSPGTEMMRPYRRVLILHMTVIFGAWMLTSFGAPASAVLTLCLVKMTAELVTLSRRGPADVAPG